MDRAHALVDHARMMGDRMDATLLVVVSDRREVVAASLERSSLPILYATGDPELLEEFAGRVRDAIRLREPISETLSFLTQVKEMLLGAFFQGMLTSEDVAVVIVTAGDAVEVVMHYDVGQDVEVVHLHEELEDDVDLRVV